MSGFTYESDFLGTLAQILADLEGYTTLANELVQNADDAVGHNGHPAASWVRFDVGDDVVEVSNDGVFSFCGSFAPECSESPRCNVHAFLRVASETKRQQEGTTGAFGIGFVSVYQITDYPEVISAGLHLILRPDATHGDQRVGRCGGCEHCRDQAGTLFRLPWAVPGSPLRTRLGQDARHDPEALKDALLGCLRDSLPFLQRIERIELLRAGHPVATFGCERVDDIVRLSGPGDDGLELHRLTGDFDAEADVLRRRDGAPIEGKRRATVQVLVGEALESGRVHAVLPTDEPFPATMLVSADFFPRSDRRSITLEPGTRGDWNRAALATVGRVVADHMEALPDLIGPVATWRLMSTVRETSLVARDEAFASLWPPIGEAIAEAPIVPTADGALVLPEDVLFIPDPADDGAKDILARLGAHALAPEVREFIRPLPRSEFGMRELSATTLAALIARGDVQSLTSKELEDLWTLMDRILGRDRGTNRAAHSEAAFRATTTAPEVDGGLVSWDQIDRADPQTTALFSRYIYLLDTPRLGRHENLRDQLASPLKADRQLVSAIAEVGPGDDELDIAQWLYGQRNSWIADDALRSAVGKLPIFPTVLGGEQTFVPLDEIVLPQSKSGEFIDAAGIAKVLDTSGSAEVVALAKLLGIQELTLETYITDHVAPALGEVAADEVRPECIGALLGALARQTEEILETQALVSALKNVPIVPCGSRCLRPTEAMFGNEALAQALGTHWPIYDGPAVARGLLEGLGVSESPQPHHVIARVTDVVGEPPTDETVTVIRALLKLMAQRYSFSGQGQAALLRDSVESDFAELLESEWLPAEGDRTDWWAPRELFLHSRAFLFKSQGRFLDMTVPEENAISDFLGALGLEANPPLEMVIAHLRHCWEHGGEARSIYTELSNKAADLTGEQITALREFPSLQLGDGTWVRPNEVFWDEPGLGQFAKRLDPTVWSQWRPLLDAIGVRQRPDHEDAIRVLQQVAGSAEREWQSDEAIVTRCWQILTESLASAETTGTFLRSQLGDVHCVPAGDELLRPPEVYADDRPQLTKQLHDKLGNTLITRPQATWHALQAAGVRAISELLIAHPTYTSSSQHNTLRRVIQERRLQINRVLESALGSAEGANALTRLEALNIVAARDLTVTWRFEPDPSVRFPASNVGAVWSRLDQTLFVEPGEFGIDLAREIAFAVDADPVRLHILERVLSAEDADDAEDVLDRLSIPRLTETHAEESEVIGAGELDEMGDNGAEELSGGDLPEFGFHNDDDQSEAGAGDDEGRAGIEDEPESEGGSNGVEHEPTESTGLEQTLEGPDSIGSSASGDINRGSPGGDRASADGRHRSNGSSGAGRGTSSVRHRHRRRGASDPAEWWQLIVSGRAVAGDDDEPKPGTSQHKRKLEIDSAGVAAVRAHERNAGRDPDTVELPHGNPGYDVVSLDSDGKIIRYIEVKSLAGGWGEGRGFPRITQRQLEFAQGRHPDADGNEVDPENVWLYVVEHAETAPRITPINDPVRSATRFVFDPGWRVLGEITLDERDIDDIGDIVRADGLPTPYRRFVPDDDPDVVFELAWPEQRVAIVTAEGKIDAPVGWTLLQLGHFKPNELLDLLSMDGTEA